LLLSGNAVFYVEDAVFALIEAVSVLHVVLGGQACYPAPAPIC
jgi:hypothetical protein